jgi:predicted DNA binding CopG/RHH family protein
MSDKDRGKPFPSLKTDEEVERFVAEADLSEYDFSEFRKMRFEFAPKSANVSMRMPTQLLAAIKDRAEREGIPYQRYIRQTLERALEDAPSEARRPSALTRP